jgi:hypothetical protein
MPRTPEAQKAYNDKKAAVLKEARSLRDSGGKLNAEHEKALNTAEKLVTGKRERYSKAKEAIVSGKEIAPNLKGAANRVSQGNVGLVERAQKYKNAPLIEDVVKNTPTPKFSSEMADLGNVKVTRNPINNDTRHHGVLTTIADSVSSKVDDAVDRNALNPGVADKAYGHLADAYSYHDVSLQHHNSGRPEEAKRNMANASESLVKAVAQVSNRKGVSLAPGIHNFILANRDKYVNSTTPGVGSRPHEDFVPNRTLKGTPVQERPVVVSAPKQVATPPKLNREAVASKVSSFVSETPEKPGNVNTSTPPPKRAEMRFAVAQKAAEQKGKRTSEFKLSSASKNAELERPEIDTSSIGKEQGFTGSQMIGQQLANWAKGAKY